jgi:ribosomal-protein-alanine N-acetyltransferase
MVMLNWFVRDPTPVLEGPNVVLRAPRSVDYVAWRDLRRESREFLKPFEPRWTEADLSRRAFGARVWRGRDEAKRGTDFSFLIFEKAGGERLVGGMTVSNIRRRAAQYANLGYWMGEAFAGRGLMTEAVGVMLPFYFGSLGLHRLHAACLPHNVASRRVLEKNGFREEGYALNYLQIDGKWADHVLFALTRETWTPGVPTGGR